MDLTDKCEGPRITATNNQVLGGVRPHQRRLNNGEAPLQVNIFLASPDALEVIVVTD